MSLKNIARESQQHESDESISSDPSFRGSGLRPRAERAPSVPPIAVTGEARPLLSIGAPADAALLEPTYAYLSAYCFACLPPQVAQRLNVAIYELYANALRYGSPRGEVRFELYKTARGARLAVTNYATADHRARLEQQMGRVQRDPEQAFASEMERFTDGSNLPSMLGLVRVAHEAGLPLECVIDGDRISIATTCPA
jgi:hypothetical protein